MPWVQRDGLNAIVGLYANQQPGRADEFLDDSNAQVIAYLNPPPVDPVDRWDLVSLRVSFNHENRIRVLEGKAAVTMAQFKNALKALP